MMNKVYAVMDVIWMYDLEENTEMTCGIFSTKENAEKAMDTIMKDTIRSAEDRNPPVSVYTETNTIRITDNFGDQDHVFRITEWTLDTYMTEDQDGYPIEIPL